MRDDYQRTIITLLWVIAILSAANFLGLNVPNVVGTWHHGMISPLL